MAEVGGDMEPGVEAQLGWAGRDLRGGGERQQKRHGDQQVAHKKMSRRVRPGQYGGTWGRKGVGITPGRSGDWASVPDGERLSPLKLRQTQRRSAATTRTLRAEPDSVRVSRTQARSR